MPNENRNTASARAPRTPASSPLDRAPRRYGARAAALLAAFVFVGLSLFWASVPCVFASVTHLPCPGCGSTRAVRALLRGDLAAVRAGNPLGPVMAFLLGVLAIDLARVVFREGSLERASASRVSQWVLRALVAVTVFEIVLWIARFFGVFGGPVQV